MHQLSFSGKLQLSILLLLVFSTAVTAGNEQLIFNKSFAASSVEIGAVTTLTFTLENPADIIAQDVAFTDNLPAGLAVAATPNVANNCSAGTLTAPAGSTTISFSGGTIPGVPMPGSTCTITVDIEGTALGFQNNITTALTTSTPTIDDSTPAIASIDVTLVEIEWDLAGTGDWFDATNWDPERVPNGDLNDPFDEIATINNGGTAVVISNGQSPNDDDPLIIATADLNIGINGGNGTLAFSPELNAFAVPFSLIAYDGSVNIGFAEQDSNPASTTNGSLAVNSADIPFAFFPNDSNPGALRIGVNESSNQVFGELNLSNDLINELNEQVFTSISVGTAFDDGPATGTVVVNTGGGLFVEGSGFFIGVSLGAGNAEGSWTGGALFGVPVFIAGVSENAGDSNAMLTSLGEIGPGLPNIEPAQIGVSNGTGNASAVVSQDLNLTSSSGFGPFDTVDIGIANGSGSASGSLLASAGMTVDTLNIGISDKGAGIASGSLLIDHGLIIADTINMGNGSTLTLNLNGPDRAIDGIASSSYSAIDAQLINLNGDLIVNLQFTPESGQQFILIDTGNSGNISNAFDSMMVNNVPVGLTANFTQANGQLLLTIGGVINPPNWINPDVGVDAGDWFDSTNWSNDIVPTTADVATVNNGGLAIADSATAPGDILAASIIAGMDGGTGSVQSNAVNITTSRGVLIGTTTGGNTRGGSNMGVLTITDAEINTGIGSSGDTGIIGVGMASGTAMATGQLMVTNSNLNTDDGIVIGFAGADEDVASSSTGTGSFVYDGISPAVSSINLNNGDLRIADASNEAPENSVLTASGSASIQNVTITGGEIQVSELSPEDENFSQQVNAQMVSLNNVIVDDAEIDVAVTNINQNGGQITADAVITLTDVSFTNVTDGDNFQSGDAGATATDAEVSSTVNQTWTRVNINAQSDFRAGFGETTSNGLVGMQVTMDIIDSNLVVDQFRIADIDATGSSINNNNTAASLSAGSTLIANDLRIADVESADISLINLNASLDITDSMISIDNQVRISQFEGNSNNASSTVMARLSLRSSSLTADNMDISVTNDSADNVDASLNLNPSLVVLNDLQTGVDGTISFGLDGLNRVTMGTVGAANSYAAIDTRTGILAGEIIADFNFIPPPGTYRFDLITADTSLNADLATLRVNNLPPLFNIVDFSVISESKLSILRLTIEGGNDLSISKLNGELILDELAQTTYLITVSNAGSDNANGVNVIDNLPVILGSATWVCTAMGAASCPAPNTGNGNINELVDIPPGGSVEFALTATVIGSEGEIVSNTATLIPPAGFIDAFADNNSATDEDGIGLFIDSFEEAEEE